MAREISARLPTGAGESAKLTALREYLFAENGFHGSRSDYYNRANSYVDRVLDDREGLPITLSILFMELAQRIGLDGVGGLPLPRHFMVAFKPKQGPEQIIDGVMKIQRLVETESLRRRDSPEYKKMLNTYGIE